MVSRGKTLFDKIWDRHVAVELGDGMALLHVDRLLMHDMNTNRSVKDLGAAGRKVRNPGLTFATPDHLVSSAPDRVSVLGGIAERELGLMRRNCAETGIRMFDVGQLGQGIVHVIGPELGLTLPGIVLLCGDSHTCTHGGLGAIAFGIGQTEVTHVLATGVLPQRKPKRMRIGFDGRVARGVTPKDLILYTIGRIGTAGGVGHAVEYAGPAIRALGIEGRLTVCNLSIELGAKMGLIAPDETTFQHLADKPFAPKGALWERAVADWRALPSDEDAVYDAEVAIDCAEVAPQVTWGTSPEMVVGVDGRVPAPDEVPAEKRAGVEAALAYMGLAPGTPVQEIAVDRVFIGSCTNSRIGDLRAAAAVAKGRKVAASVTAWVVPGSEGVKRQAEAEGLDKVFLAAGFEWRQPSCSMCLASNGDRLKPGERSVSTSNRNFVGRQGPGARTHLASPAMAAASAIAGHIADVRKLEA
jgi:3-isopropylmalate/(R)-2-methylmalate dehydratase large subunit